MEGFSHWPLPSHVLFLMLKVDLNHFVIMATCRISMVSVSKNWWKALQKRRKECSLWNRNTHIKKEYSLHHGTGTRALLFTASNMDFHYFISDKYSSKKETLWAHVPLSPRSPDPASSCEMELSSWNRNTHQKGTLIME